MAESVDALVSNTNDSNVVPVRPRLRVQMKTSGQSFFDCPEVSFLPFCDSATESAARDILRPVRTVFGSGSEGQ